MGLDPRTPLEITTRAENKIWPLGKYYYKLFLNNRTHACMKELRTRQTQPQKPFNKKKQVSIFHTKMLTITKIRHQIQTLFL